MSSARAFWLGWSLWALCVALVLAIGVVTRPGWAGWLPPLATLGMPTIGALIVWRRPGNAIGWLFCALGVAWVLAPFPDTYLNDGLPSRPFPGWEWAVWAGSWAWIPAVLGTLTFPLLLFPDGRLLSPRWRVIAWLAGLTIVALVIDGAVCSATIWHDPLLANPARIAAVARARSVLDAPLSIVTIIVFPVLFVAPVTSLVLRLRRARGVERQQLRWFAAVALLIVAGSVGLGIMSALITALTGWDTTWTGDVIWSLSPAIAILGLPLAIGLAILRHGLYDVEQLIHRTLVYGPLTVSLVALYGLLVVTFGRLAQGLSGQGSDLVTALSTLAVAALFHPLRRRIQTGVDQRFFRRRYDATRTIASFSSRLREEVDLDTLVVELHAVIHATMQPCHVSVWLRAPAAPQRE